MWRKLAAVLIVIAGVSSAAWQAAPPESPEPLRFAVIGDNGTGDQPEYDVGRQMASARGSFPFEMVLMLGDNMYGSQRPQDFVDKFQRPYKMLLDAQVPFYAVLGNHDEPTNRSYSGFNMKGERYYTFAMKQVRFVFLDTNLLDPKQVAWTDDTLKQAPEAWKIVCFHHPLYSDGGRHGSDVELRVVLEPILVKYGVEAVFSGHDHIYERIKPQKGITYFVEGASGQLRMGDDNKPSPTAAAWFDQDQTFMLVEMAGDQMSFKTISRTGRVVDSGVIARGSPL